MKKENLNFGFLFLNGYQIGKKQKAINDINNHEILGYVNDDLKYNHLLLSNILNAAKLAYQNQPDNLEQRINKLYKLCDLLNLHLDELSKIMSAEIGKRILDCKQEIKRSIVYIQDTIKWYQEHYLDFEIINDNTWTHNDHKTGLFKRIPLGVVLGIVPFNFPINLLITKMAPAYLTGNAVIIKCSSKARLTTSYFSSLVYKAGIDNNMIQIIDYSGDNQLIDNNVINMISFTGSSLVGDMISKICYNKAIVLEMGGKDACLVLDDANLNEVVNDIIKGAFSFNGQRCTAIKKVLISKVSHDKLIELLVEKINKLSIGSSLDDNDITPMIDNKSIYYLCELARDAQSKNAKIIPELKYDNKYFYPCIVDNANEKMRICHEEQFGPLLPIQTYESLDHAIEIINASKYGLQCSIYTKNEKLFFELANKIDVGTINWNGPSSRGPDIFPFLGVKQSGFGVQGIKDALESMTRIKGYVINK